MTDFLIPSQFFFPDSNILTFKSLMIGFLTFILQIYKAWETTYLIK